MRKRALRKDFFVEIRKSFNRFASIFLIVALGVAFFAGLQATAPDMRASGDAYFDAQKLMDLKVISTMGLTEADVQALEELEGVRKAEGAWMTDVLSGDGADQRVLHIESITENFQKLAVTQGSLPQSAGECFIDAELAELLDVSVGDVITVEEESESESDEEDASEEDSGGMLAVTEYVIAGIGSSPQYISFGRGNSTLGSGEVAGVLYVTPESFDVDYYVQIWIEAEGAREMSAFSEEYEELIARVEEEIGGIEEVRCQIRRDEIAAEAKSEIADGWEELAEAESELEDARREAESELAEAESEIAKGEQELADGRQELADAREEIESNRQELAEAKEELASGRQELADGRQELEASRQELADGRQELETGRQELESGRQELEASRQELETGRQELEASRQELESGRQELEASRQELESGRQELESGRQELESGRQELETNRRQLTAAKEEIETNRQRLADARQEIETGYQELESGGQELESSRQTLTASQEEYDASAAQLAEGWTQLAGAKALLDAREAEYETSSAQLSAAQSAVSEAEAQLAQQSAQTAEGRAQLSQRWTEYENLRAQLEAAAGTPEGQAAWEAAQPQLEQTRQELEAAESELAAAEEQIAQAGAALETQKGELEAGWQELAQGRAQLDAAWEEYDAQEAQLSAAQAEADSGAARLAEGWAQLAAGEAELNAAAGQLAQAEQELADGEAQLAQAEQEVTDGEAQLAQAEQELADGEERLAQAEQELADGEAQFAQAEQELTDGEAQLARAEQELADGEAQLAQAERELAAGESELAEAEREIREGEAQLADAEAELADGEAQLADAEAELADGEAQLADAEAEVADGESELADAEAQLADARREYEEGKAEAEQEIADAEQEIADARQELADAEAEITDLETPEWSVTTREDDTDYTGYGDNSDRMASIAQVFPAMFFLVAALISLTTMTRMVEEERTQIGTLKALGYGKGAIAMKYICYALLATISGSLAGALAGQKLLPFIIIEAYGMMYPHMDAMVLPYQMDSAGMATAIAVACTALAAISACYKELAATPAVLMRPPSPKEGKRVLLERIGLIWNHLNFTWKSTLRNLFRYKKRFLMTIFGISGCMALLVVGFGLRDCILDIAVLQYGELQLYDAMVILDDDAGEAELEALETAIRENEQIAASMEVYMKIQTMEGAQGSRDVYLMVPESLEGFREFVCLRDRLTHEEYTLDDSGLVLSEKTAKLLGVSVGDSILLKPEAGREISVTISAICENYMLHYAYLSPGRYEELFGEAPEYNNILLQTPLTEESEIEEAGRRLLREEAALSISYTSSISDQLDDMLGALDMVIVVIILSAGLLALVVLYNLNNINISERQRELATLKVLGFYDREVSAYMYRENILLTVLGAFLGLALGYVLLMYTVQTVEIDDCMFGREITVLSCVGCFLITCAFSMLVNVVMHFRLKKIDMVESLKSVE